MIFRAVSLLLFLAAAKNKFVIFLGAMSEQEQGIVTASECMLKMQEFLELYNNMGRQLAESQQKYAVDAIKEIVNLLPTKYGVKNKYLRMAWPDDPVRHLQMLFEWLDKPRIKARLEPGWSLKTNFYIQAKAILDTEGMGAREVKSKKRIIVLRLSQEEADKLIRETHQELSDLDDSDEE